MNKPNDMTGSTAIYQKSVADVCLTCPYPKCLKRCLRFAEAMKAAKKPDDKRGRRPAHA